MCLAGKVPPGHVPIYFCVRSYSMNGLLAIILLLGLVFTGLWVWSLIHCITNKRLSDGNRVIGIVCILLLGLIGSGIYLALPRDRRTSKVRRGAIGKVGTARHGKPMRPVRGGYRR